MSTFSKPADPNDSSSRSSATKNLVERNRSQMGYAAIKSVLRFMDPNKRIDLTRTCPELRVPEQATPLRMESLEFGEEWLEARTVVNDITYTVGTVLIGKEGSKLPAIVNDFNDFGGYPYDVLPDGKRDMRVVKTLLPGNFELEPPMTEKMHLRNAGLRMDKDTEGSIEKIWIQFTIRDRNGVMRTEHMERSKKMDEAHHYRNTLLLKVVDAQSG